MSNRIRSIACNDIIVYTQRTSAATAWNVLASFGYDSLLTELNGDGVHRLSNALTFADANHKRFDAMEVWFEKTAVRHISESDHLNVYSLSLD